MSRALSVHRPSLARLLVVCMLALAAAGVEAADAPLGDRLVLSINNLPYTQRQVEIYIAVKESLRKPATGPDGAAAKSAPVRLVESRNWGDALTVFAEDMIILQEAQRLGSFQSADQLLTKYDQVVKARIAGDRELRDGLLRLGADEQAVARTLETVLRVAAFRRSRDRQEQISGDKDAPELDGGSAASGAKSARWLVELQERGVVRRYEGASEYQMIQPQLGKTVDGL
jgi:hypothetical protein